MNVGPFERHIREAIELNRRRAPGYAEASAGVSLRISNSLVRREQILLPFARWLDRRGRRYARAGVPILEELFVSMDGAPPFSSHVAPMPPEVVPPAPRHLARRLRRARAQAGFPAAADLLERELEGLAADPGYWCMLRHMLESALRISTLAESHEARARRAGLPSPLWIHRLLFRLHLAALPGAARLDARALPLQRQGIPILSRDLPPIPPRP